VAVQRTPKLVVTCVLWEFSAITTTISALLQRGFADDDIQAIGILEGSIASGREYLLNIGLPGHVTKLYGCRPLDGPGWLPKTRKKPLLSC
jgi:hypothetical protein